MIGQGKAAEGLSHENRSEAVAHVAATAAAEDLNGETK